MRAVVLVCLFATLAFARFHYRESEYQSEFLKFVQDYNKAYDSVTETFDRFSVFKMNLNKINEINAQNLTWWAGINEFSDLTEEEFLATHTGHFSGDHEDREELPSTGNEANDIDWRDKGAVTAVKNQGSCGSCWAFSATAAVEGYWFLKGNTLVQLADQQVLDCCKDSCAGCNGGQESNAIGWVGKTGGLCNQKDYPYTARAGACKTSCTKVAKCSGVKRVYGEPALVTALNSLPVSVAVNAGGGWQSYKGGVFTGPCSQQLNHAVLAVGYNGQAFVIKNSWGAGWGDKGYIQLARGKSPTTCGVGKEPSDPT
jgi:C1A family cysteine protease